MNMTSGERHHSNLIVRKATNTMGISMLTNTAIISANMRGGYVNVGTTVHTLFRMNRRPSTVKEIAVEIASQSQS